MEEVLSHALESACNLKLHLQDLRGHVIAKLVNEYIHFLMYLLELQAATQEKNGEL